MENKFIKCKSCGTELTEATKFCTNCGAKLETEITQCMSCGKELAEADAFCPRCGTKRGGKRKNPRSKKLIVLLSLVILFVISVVLAVGINASSESTPTTFPSINAPKSKKPVTFIESATNRIANAESVKLYEQTVKMVVGEDLDYVEVESDETGITICISYDGLADLVTTAKSIGLDETFTEWVNFRNKTLELYYSLIDTASYYDLDGTTIYLAVVNDTNPSNAVMVVADGIVIYDYMAE